MTMIIDDSRKWKKGESRVTIQNGLSNFVSFREKKEVNY